MKDSTISTGCDSSSLTAIGKGTAKLIDQNGVCWTLENLSYVPKLNTNLVALSQLASQITIKSTGENVNVFLNNAATPSFVCPTKNKVLETRIKLGSKCLSTRNRLWHQRLGHLNNKATKRLIPTYKAAEEVCDECVKGYTTTKFLRRKEDTFAALKDYKAWAENLHQRRVVKVVLDGGGEFVNRCFKKYLEIEGFEHSISPPYTPEHNGIAVRGNRSVLEKARCLMQQTKLTDQFWAEATKIPPLSNLRTFGCKAWVRIPPIKRRSKFESIAWEGIMLGYENQASAYQILRLQDKRVVISRNVKLNETNFPNLLPPLNSKKLPHPVPMISPKAPNPYAEPDSIVADEDDSYSDREDEFHDTVEEIPQRRIRIIGPRHPTLITGDISENNILPYQRRAHQTIETNPIPKSYQQAINSENGNLKRTRQHAKAKMKEDDQKQIIEHKARLCAQGFHQIQGLDYSQTFSPTGRISLLRALISNAAVKNLQFHQIDVKSAFLNAPLNEDICLAVPEGINIPTSKGGIQPYLEALAIFGPDITSFKEEIQGKFNMKDLGKANLLLGIKILHNEAGFSLSQEHYIKNISENFNITKLAPVNTPLKPGLQLTKASRSEIEAFQKLGLNYRSIIGALNYISRNTRPDITFAISHLSQFLEQPGLENWMASLQVLCYLYHTKERTLNYHNRGKHNIICYADADWGNSLIDQRSVGGYTLFLNHHLISWKTKKQKKISHSTTEAEYKSLSDASKEVLWFQKLLQEINLDVPGNIPTLYNDNKGAIDLAHSNINHNGFKAKHMVIKFHFIRDLIKNLILELFHVSTHLMAADFLTKVVGKTILLRSKSFINPSCSSQGRLLKSLTIQNLPLLSNQPFSLT
ncbi:hypothetical protein O181_020129 [Austropuccinia psidii MF-1]|uniref:Integrase catalytic domain-containing protein n=1 Tax=Austropuccinia psidii MF-1 TaxID=1389203 RepID=A0A9Q3GVE3_9BASI|nr:hypothetical protein [Austropuccinia psidii MF-1]